MTPRPDPVQVLRAHLMVDRWFTEKRVRRQWSEAGYYIVLDTREKAQARMVAALRSEIPDLDIEDEEVVQAQAATVLDLLQASEAAAEAAAAAPLDVSLLAEAERLADSYGDNNSPADRRRRRAHSEKVAAHYSRLQASAPPLDPGQT